MKRKGAGETSAPAATETEAWSFETLCSDLEELSQKIPDTERRIAQLQREVEQSDGASALDALDAYLAQSESTTKRQQLQVRLSACLRSFDRFAHALEYSIGCVAGAGAPAASPREPQGELHEAAVHCCAHTSCSG